ncbi:hypothetical protein C5S39_03385 [Candidatus Methanophagaceae archaeon]|nr:hypothetical protein C5S39_03385 [Methanophagales archaeon]
MPAAVMQDVRTSLISDNFFLCINTYQRILFDGFSCTSRTIGHPSPDKNCESAQKIDYPMKPTCRNIQSCKLDRNLLQDA